MTTPEEAANRRHEMAKVHSLTADAIAAAERLRLYGGLPPLAASVAMLLASDLASAGRRLDWLRKALEEREAAA